MKRLLIHFILSAFAAPLTHCTTPTSMKEADLSSLAEQDAHLLLEAPEDNEKVIVYQIFTRLFGNLGTQNVRYGTVEENGVGKFNDINDQALSSLSALGVTHVWYTGVVEHAVLNDYQAHGIALDDADVVKGRAGSPYAIKDYYDVNPDLAEAVPNRLAEFEALVARTHANGLKVLIDFVPNHVARFYQSDAKPDSVEDFGAQDDRKQAFAPQ